MDDVADEDHDDQLSATAHSTAEGGLDEIVARQEEMGQKDLPAEGDEGSSEGAVTSAG